MAGWVYLIRHHGHGLLQIGITNEPDVRLASHRSRGWALVDLTGPMDGSVAREREKSILQALKARGAMFAGAALAGPFSGYTESWVEVSCGADSVRQLLDAVESAEVDGRD